MNHERVLFRAAMVADGESVQAAPGVILLEGDRIVASGSPQQVGGGGGGEGCRVVDLPRSVMIPGLVNAHAHLDLTHIGPQPYPCTLEGDFAAWIEMIRAERGELPEEIERSVRLGVELSKVGGTAIIGDIGGSGSPVPIRALRDAGMAGVSFLEVFGLGDTQPAAVSRLRMASESIAANERGVLLGLQPHAPYSCGPLVFQAAVDSGLPLSTHLAETLEEIEFVQSATGPIERMLKRFGVWNEGIKAAGVHPIDHLLPFLRKAPWIAAHMNYIEDRHLEALSPSKGVRLTVAYCPRASEYFGHPQKRSEGLGLGTNRTHSVPSPHSSLLVPHRYRDMLASGIYVALGTDSIVCLETADRISVLDEMRFLYRRDGTDPIALLRMATINGATALGFDPGLVTLSTGRTAGLLAIDLPSSTSDDPLHAVLMSNDSPRWIHTPDSWGQQP